MHLLPLTLKKGHGRVSRKGVWSLHCCSLLLRWKERHRTLSHSRNLQGQMEDG